MQSLVSHQLSLAAPVRQRAASPRSSSSRCTRVGRPQRLRVAAAAEFSQSETIQLGVLLVGTAGIMTALGPGAQALGMKKGRVSSGQPPGWYAKADAMKAAGVKSLSPKDASDAMAKGWLLVDVSPEEEFVAYHATGSVNVPAVKLGAGADSTALSSLRGALFSSQGVQATYENPDFVAEVRAAMAKAKAKGVIFCCAYGGTLTGSVNFPDGQASRSLLAVAKLVMEEKETAATVAHLRGGTPAWFKDGFPGEGADAEWDPKRGRMPTVGGPQWEQDNKELIRD